MGSGSRMGARRRLCLLICTVLATLAIPLASAAGVEIINPSSFSLNLLFPVLTALSFTAFMWIFLIPNSLSSLQVAFEIDDRLYEVHRLTRTREDARELLKLPLVGFGLAMYIMAMTGILLLMAELIFQPAVYFQPNVILIAFLVLFPVLLSPWETFNAQIEQMYRDQTRPTLLIQVFRRTWTLGTLLLGTGFVLWLGIQREGSLTPLWMVYGLLVFMSPTILAYGRIMGASWNMLILNKWRSVRGRSTPIDPDKPGVGIRLTGFILCIFLVTMPITAVNGIITVLYVMLNEPANSEEVLNFGGIVGYSIYQWAEINQEWVEKWVSIKQLASTLTIYLSLNVAIVGLAFIFELTRNLFLGGQTFGGMGGVLLSSPREIRSETRSQAKILYFGFAGFSGYTVLLLILICYKEFSQLMPFTGFLEDRGFSELVILKSTWLFIAVGQGIFLLTWLMSISRFGHLTRLRFDLSPDERREGAIMAGGGDWMRELIEQAARMDDIDQLRRFQLGNIDGDDSVVRLEKSRARMVEMALRGLWPAAVEEARKVLAQQGGEDDEARMLISVGHIASRRLDAAREALRGLERPEGYDEPELIAFVAEWIDPWNGQVSQDDLWDWENNPCIDNLTDCMKRLRSWQPVPAEKTMHGDRLSFHSRIGHVAMLRAQRRSDEALDLALELIKAEPLSAKVRIAASLCLLDKGDWHSANSIYLELMESDRYDPRVKALGAILGVVDDTTEFEVSIAVGDIKSNKKWVDEAPVNSVAALHTSKGEDEALSANVLVAAHLAVEKRVPPRYSKSPLSIVFSYFVIMPMWWVLGIYATYYRPLSTGIAIAAGLTILQLSHSRFRRNQRRVIKHRDQKAMIAYARRLRRHKARLCKDSIPIGNHMLLSGLLLPVNGAIYDVGLPGWMVVRLPQESDKRSKERLKKRSKRIGNNKPARLKPLAPGWWLKRPKEVGADGAFLQQVIGPSAYRGRSQFIARKTSSRKSMSGAKQRGRVPITQRDLGAAGISHDTIRSERAGGPRLPSRRGEKKRPPGEYTDFDV